MSTATEITRLQEARNVLRNKAVDLGISTSTAKLDTLAAAYDGIENRGAVSASVQEGDTYTIPKGYHNGSGTVSGVSGGGNYTLQSKSVTPTKSQQNITPDNGYFGLSDVTVGAIPEAYQDVSAVTANAADVLANKVIVDADGNTVAGTMPNIGTVSKTLDTTNTSFTIAKGYHSGSGKVSVVTEEKSITPTTATQNVTPESGKVLSKVTVNPIPAEYITTDDATAVAGEILKGKTAYVDGTKITGSMPNNGAAVVVLDTNTTKYTIPAGYHSGSGTVSIVVNEDMEITPTKSEQVFTPVGGTVYGGFTVKPIPAAYQDVTGVTAAAENVLIGKYFVDANGNLTNGKMANNGSVSNTMDGLTVTSVSIPAGYTTGGTVSLTDDIERALAAI